MKKSLFILTLAVFFYGCGGGGSGSGDDPVGGGSTPTPSPEPVVFHQLIADEKALSAARFLIQASFGPTEQEIIKLRNSTFENWIDEQMSLPQTRQLPLLDARIEDAGLDPLNQDVILEAFIKELLRSDIWWETVLFAEDQLRQRVAFALSEVFVISTVSDTLFNDSRGVANYHDMLAEHAFGNFRDLLEAVTLSPMMGDYLSMVRNEKSDPVRNIRPDENYARELMQLFSIGLVMLNNDGSEQLDQDGNAIPTYNQDIIKAFARIFTGWMYGDAPNWYWFEQTADSEILPMQAFEFFHDKEAKTLLNGAQLPAGQSAQQDLDDALDNIFSHPNVAPFICKQLIMRLITSNPSPAYVNRVASVFNDNGRGERGDLAAVVRTILLDDEARNGHTADPEVFGKLREPLLKIAAIWRAFKVSGIPSIDDEDRLGPATIRYYDSFSETGQRPFGSPSVFNFFQPQYSQTGAISDGGYRSPEFQILSENFITATTNRIFFSAYLSDMDSEGTRDSFYYLESTGGVQLDFSAEKALAEMSGDLIDRLNLLLMAGQMSESMRSTIIDYLDIIPIDDEELLALRVYEAVFLITSSPEFAVQR